MRDDDEPAKVIRKLHQSLVGDAMIDDGRYFARLVEEIAAPLPKLPETASPREVYFHVLLQNLQANALRALGLVA
ncbi:hypothetical protein [Bradyrhizobium cytisi]|uniref:Uncharacterized protein n=1 Tax=Bradyrhizobium cytisi TaxID=515489 RepID=A0A5S4WUK3_9BRAD|nr:hypothetical protein [Bradyrhizobium cytisi]TYL85716.1 hypothetical protein FXB38_09160 [Bradyrhizobium cytisi]